MLGHAKPQGDANNIFRVISETLTERDLIIATFLLYCSRYTVLPLLHRVTKGSSLFRFLGIFGGVTIKVPKSPEEATEKSLLPEVQTFFGEDTLKAMLLEFGGRSVKVPPLHVMRHSIRDVDIYCQISGHKRAGGDDKVRDTVRELSRHYGLSRHEVWWIFRRVATAMDPTFSDEQFTSLIVPDEAVESIESEYVG